MLGGSGLGRVPNLKNYPALVAEVYRLKVGSWSIGKGMKKVCEANGFEYIGHEEMTTGYARINELLQTRGGAKADSPGS